MNKFFINVGALFIGTLVLFASVNAESGLSWRVFNQDQNTWIYQPKGLMLFSTLSRTVKPVAIDVVRPIDTLTDCILYDGYIWVSCNAGLYQIDASSQSIERIPLPESDSTAFGKIAQDADYLWLGTGNKLLRFDKLGREWFSFDLPQKVDRMVGLWSNGDEVFCLGDKMLYRFTTSTEKWNAYPLDKVLSSTAIFYPGASTFKVVDGAAVMLYQPESFAWLTTNLGSVPLDIVDKDNDIYCNFGTNIKQVNCSNGMVKPLNIPNLDNVVAIAVTGDSLVMTMEKRVAAFSLVQETMNFTEHDKGIPVDKVVKILPIPAFNVMFTEKNIVIYEKNTKVWQVVPRAGMQQKIQNFTWNEEECSVRFGKGVTSKISGNLESGLGLQSAGYAYDTISYTMDTANGVIVRIPVVDSQPLLNFSLPEVYGNLSVHTSDKENRVADVFFNNTSFITAPKKGLYYRGNKDDYLNTLRLGTTTNEQMAGQVLPQVDMEGGSAVFESKQKLAKRDRKVARIAGGSGFLTSRTVKKKLPYRADGTYYLFETDATDTAAKAEIAIIPGTLKVSVDGALLDTSYYTLYSSTGKLEFNTSSPVDPVSSLTVEYQEQPLPKGEISDVEFKPSNHFGRLHYGTLTLSPTEWISTRVGFTGIDKDSMNSIVTASTPIELRNDKTKLMLKATPEFSYNVTNGSKAGGATVQSRIGDRTGIEFTTRLLDEDFISTDTFTTGLGDLRSEYEFKVNHDIRQELPLNYSQHQRFTNNGSENRYEFTSGVHFSHLPFFDVTTSRTKFIKDDTVSAINVFDSMFYKKDKLHLRLYETSAAFLEKVTNFSKIAYDIGHSEYRSNTLDNKEWNSGRVTTMQFTLIPVQKIILLGEMLYRGSVELEGAPSSDIIPRMSFQLMDIPQGVDIAGYYTINNKRFWTEQLSTDTIMRTVKIVLRPGQWYAPLGWFSPRAQLSQNIQSTFQEIDISPWEFLTGKHGIDSRDITKELGVNIFPFDGMMLTNTNRWSDNSRTDDTKFTTINRMQWVFNSRNIFTATYNYSGESADYVQNGLLMYEKTWTSWLRTSPAGLFDAKKDSLGEVLSIGPKLTVNLNFQDFGIFRMLNNIHDVKLLWNKVENDVHSTPDFAYTFSLRLNIKPNLELSNIEQIQLKEGKYETFISRLNLFVYF